MARGRATPEPVRLAPAEAAALLVAHHGLRRAVHPRGAAGVRALLRRARCIQLDPLEPLGSNADLVALARLEGISRGDVYRWLLPGHAFEHYAKERCLLPASAFRWYRAQAEHEAWLRRAPWRFLERRARKLGPARLEAVLAEVRERGPIGPAGLGDHGEIVRHDWNGWKTTGKAGSMALQVLWFRCQIVVAGRDRNGNKLYDVPERALPRHHRAGGTRRSAPADPEAFGRWALLERVEAAGLLSRNAGPAWRLIEPWRTRLADGLVEEGLLEEVAIDGSPRRYLAPRGFRGRPQPGPDGRMRLIGPLDAVIWDRALVREAFGFDYVWEVYKPRRARTWGWYVVPLLHGDRFVGRLEGEVKDGVLAVRNLWPERGARLDRGALADCLERHAAACGAARVELRRRGGAG